MKYKTNAIVTSALTFSGLLSLKAYPSPWLAAFIFVVFVCWGVLVGWKAAAK